MYVYYIIFINIYFTLNTITYFSNFYGIFHVRKLYIMINSNFMYLIFDDKYFRISEY